MYVRVHVDMAIIGYLRPSDMASKAKSLGWLHRKDSHQAMGPRQPAAARGHGAMAISSPSTMGLIHVPLQPGVRKRASFSVSFLVCLLQ